MPDTAAVAQRPLEEYKSDEKPTWCPGCGDFGVLNGLYNAMRVKGYQTKDIVVVSGIGCSTACRSSSPATASTASTGGPCRSRRASRSPTRT